MSSKEDRLHGLTEIVKYLQSINTQALNSSRDLSLYYSSARAGKPYTNNLTLNVSEIHTRLLKDVDNLKAGQIDAILEEAGLSEAAGFDRSNLWRVKYVLSNYGFVRTNVTGAVKEFEGMACSVDKFSTLLKLYMKQEIMVRRGSKDMPMFLSPVREDNRWCYVEESTIYAWFEYLDSLPYLFSGQTDVFVSAHNNLKSAYDL